MKEKASLLRKYVCFQLPEKGLWPDVILRVKYFSEILLLSQKLFTSEGAISHNVVYYQQLTIACDQANLYAYE